MGINSTNSGVVKFFLQEKGYGFIVDNTSKEDVYVHFSGTLDRIKQGDEVEFDIESGEKGPKAVNVKRVKK